MLAWGSFLTIAINFLIVAAVLFALVNVIQRIRQKDGGEAAGGAAAAGGSADGNSRSAGEALAQITEGDNFRSESAEVKSRACSTTRRLCGALWCLDAAARKIRARCPPPDTEMLACSLIFARDATQFDHAYLHGWRIGANGGMASST